MITKMITKFFFLSQDEMITKMITKFFFLSQDEMITKMITFKSKGILKSIMINSKVKDDIEILITSKKTYREISKLYNGMSFTTIKKIKDNMINYTEKYKDFIKIKAIRKVLELPRMFGYFDDITQDTIKELIRLKELFIKNR